MRKLLILCAGGHGRVVADVALSMECFDEIAYLDDSCPQVQPPFPVIGPLTSLDRYLDSYEIFVASGNAMIRRKYLSYCLSKGAKCPVLVHKAAIISGTVEIGDGSLIMPGTIVNANAKIGKGVIINTNASIEHDCKIGDFVHASAGSTICGTVIIGENTLVGAGSTIINNITIASNIVVGAGAVVTSDLLLPGTYVGVPAKLLK